MPKENSGRKSHQKMKPYLVYQYLLRNTDENHVVSAEQIVGFLQETCGIEAERRSIYKDIDAIKGPNQNLQWLIVGSFRYAVNRHGTQCMWGIED